MNCNRIVLTVLSASHAVPEFTHSLVTSLASVMEDENRPARETRWIGTMLLKLE
jgi:hypothetical protein